MENNENKNKLSINETDSIVDKDNENEVNNPTNENEKSQIIKNEKNGLNFKGKGKAIEKENIINNDNVDIATTTNTNDITPMKNVNINKNVTTENILLKKEISNNSDSLYQLNNNDNHNNIINSNNNEQASSSSSSSSTSDQASSSIKKNVINEYEKINNKKKITSKDKASSSSTSNLPTSTSEAPINNSTLADTSTSNRTVINNGNYPITVFRSSSSSSSLNYLMASASLAQSSIVYDYTQNPMYQENGNGNYEMFLGLRYSSNHLLDIIMNPAPINQNMKCTVIRRKEKNQMVCELYIENTDSSFTLLLVAKKVRNGNKSEFIISKKPFQVENVETEENIIGRVRSNFIGTAFVVYDNNKKKVNKDDIENLRKELCSVIYESNILGFKGPRKMTIIIPRLDENENYIKCKPKNVKETLIERSKDPFDKEILVLHNKSPQWNEETQSYVLNFNHRVRIASVKNFQIINNDDLDYIIMQFGKTRKNIFTLDFRYPFSALIAFSIALTSLDPKLACE